MDFQAIIAILNLLGFGGIGVFLYFTYRGLLSKITSLAETSEEQRKTLEAVRVRAVEADSLSQKYKAALCDFEEMSGKLDELRNRIVREYEEALIRKDQEVAKLKTKELHRVDEQLEYLRKLPALELQISNSINEMSTIFNSCAPTIRKDTAKDLVRLYIITGSYERSSIGEWFQHKNIRVDQNSELALLFQKLLGFEPSHEQRRHLAATDESAQKPSPGQAGSGEIRFSRKSDSESPEPIS